MDLLAGKRIAFLGGGAMGSALLGGILKAKLVAPSDVAFSEPDKARREKNSQEFGVQGFETNTEAVKFADILVMAVKPNVVPIVLNEIKGVLNSKKLLISIAAGVPTSKIESLLSGSIPVIRVMPNTAALVGEAASALSRGSYASESDLEIAEAILGAVGTTSKVPESLLDAVTGLSGSGPAYAFIMIEALSDGGVQMGLPRAISTELAAQTLLGAAKMVLQTGKHPGALKDMVTSPGGTTIAGVAEMERAGVRSALFEAVKAATIRSEELGKGK